MPKSEFISEIISGLIVMAVWTAWAVASAVALSRLRFFSPAPLLRAPQRYSKFTLLEPAAIAVMYVGLSLLAGVALHPWLTASSRPSPTTAAMTTSELATAAATTPAAAPSRGLSALTPEELGRLQIIDSAIKVFLVGVMIFLARRLVVGGLPALGLSPRMFLPGILAGINALWLLVPWMLLTMVLTEIIRKLLTGSEPAENPILKALKEHPNGWTTTVLIASEAVLAPVVEELFFRGFLQTALLRIGRARGEVEVPSVSAESPDSPGSPGSPGSPSSPSSLGFEPVLPYQPREHVFRTEQNPAPVTARWRWITILIVSAIFASVHFMGDNPEVLPIIFVLAIALGYLYERTGNLFACMTLHAAFNTTVTILNHFGAQ